MRNKKVGKMYNCQFPRILSKRRERRHPFIIMNMASAEVIEKDFSTSITDLFELRRSVRSMRTCFGLVPILWNTGLSVITD